MLTICWPITDLLQEICGLHGRKSGIKQSNLCPYKSTEIRKRKTGMKMEGRADRSSAIERPTCSSVVLNSHNNGTECQAQSHQDVMLHSHHHRHASSSAVRNIEIDWREVDPYFSELSDCASFWTLINFVSKYMLTCE